MDESTWTPRRIVEELDRHIATTVLPEMPESERGDGN